jgi:hypothetical protein
VLMMKKWVSERRGKRKESKIINNRKKTFEKPKMRIKLRIQKITDVWCSGFSKPLFARTGKIINIEGYIAVNPYHAYTLSRALLRE